MLITIEELRKYIQTEESDEMLATRLEAVELSIRKYTNNNFANRGVWADADIKGSVFMLDSLTPFEVGDTIMLSHSGRQQGKLCTVAETHDLAFTVNESVYEEEDVRAYTVEYPADVKLAAVNILRWQLKNEAANSGDKSRKEVQSETLSRYSVTYAADATETDISADFGVPKKLVTGLKRYKNARF